jgi:hypothetical protein
MTRPGLTQGADFSQFIDMRSIEIPSMKRTGGRQFIVHDPSVSAASHQTCVGIGGLIGGYLPIARRS